jgi:membrane protein YdbS with pleckstrin-like domain
MSSELEWFSPDPGETVVWTGKPRVRRILTTVAGGIVWSVVALAAAYVVTRYVPQFIDAPLPVSGTVVWGVAALIVAVQAVQVAVAYQRVQATDYVLTDRSVYKKTGILSENVTRVGVDRVQNTTLRKDFTGNLFDYGTVLLSTAGGGAELAITDLNDPDEFRSELRPLIGAAGGPGGTRADASPAPGLDAETVDTLVEEARRMRETAERMEAHLE